MPINCQSGNGLPPIFDDQRNGVSLMAHVHFQKNNVTREVKAGFSWTVFFFGAFPFAFRGQWGWFFLTALICMATLGFGGVVVAFFANKVTGRWLAENGWTVTAGIPPASWGFQPALLSTSAA